MLNAKRTNVSKAFILQVFKTVGNNIDYRSIMIGFHYYDTHLRYNVIIYSELCNYFDSNPLWDIRTHLFSKFFTYKAEVLSDRNCF